MFFQFAIQCLVAKKIGTNYFLINSWQGDHYYHIWADIWSKDPSNRIEFYFQNWSNDYNSRTNIMSLLIASKLYKLQSIWWEERWDVNDEYELVIVASIWRIITLFSSECNHYEWNWWFKSSDLSSYFLTLTKRALCGVVR